MSRLSLAGIRSGAVAIALLLAIGLTQQSALAAAAIAVNPTSGAVNSTVQVTGSGFPVGQSVNIFFGSTYEGTALASATGAIAISFAVPNVGPGTVTITASGGSGATATFTTTQFTVTAPGTPLTVQKAVTINGLGYVATGTARANDQLTYRITVTNTTGAATASAVTVTDPLSAGQTPFVSTSNCTAAGSTVTCSTATPLTAGAQATFYFTTVVTPGFSGNIPNTAYASATNVASTPSNTTLVTVVPASTTTFSLQLCGTVTAFTFGSTGGSITIGGVVRPIAAGATFTGSTVAVGTNLCLGLITNSAGSITSVTAGLNLTGLGLVCGVYGTSTTAGFISVGGVLVPLAPTLTVTGVAVPGAVYCFVLNGSGQIYAVLSTIPTSITFPHTRISLNRWAARAD